jgi:hypothetical protein
MKIYITTCSKKIAYTKRIKELLSNSPYEFFFVYGQGNQDKIEPFIEIDVQEAYENLPEKTFCLVEHFMKNFPDEKLVKMDDDNFLDTAKLKSYESVIEDYVGFFHAYELGEFGKFFHWYKMKNEEYKVFKKHFRLAYAEGAMYILSRKACQKIIDKGRDFFKNTPETYLGEDVKVGLCLDTPEITKKDIKLPNDLHYDITQDFLSAHPINLLVFDKLRNAKTNEEKMELLKQYNYLNENALRIEFLKKIKKNIENNE